MEEEKKRVHDMYIYWLLIFMSPAKTAIQKLDKLCMRGVTERERERVREGRDRGQIERDLMYLYLHLSLNKPLKYWQPVDAGRLQEPW